MDGFVDVYSKATGVKHRVPPHYLDNPRLMKPFRKTPKTREAAAEQPANEGTVVSQTGDATTDTPAAGDKE